MLLNILIWIVVGGVAGWLASLLVRGAGLGIIGDIIVGILGAFIGGFLYGFFGHAGVTGFNIGSTICAVIGAVILLVILRAVTRPRAA